MMSKLQASKWFINKQNQSTEATVNLPSPLTLHSPLSLSPPSGQLMTTVQGEQGVECGYQQHLIKTQITETSGQCKKLFLVYILYVCVCGCILEISSFRQHFRQLNHVRNEK